MHKDNKAPIIDIFVDGGCNNKRTKTTTGAGGYGYVLVSDNQLIDEGGSWKIGEEVKSGRMEVMGMRAVLSIIQERNQEDSNFTYIIHCDSQYVINTFNESWLRNWIDMGILNQKANADLWQNIWDIYLTVKRNVKFRWVKGHVKIKEEMTNLQKYNAKWNDKVDQIATFYKRKAEEKVLIK